MKIGKVFSALVFFFLIYPLGLVAEEARPPDFVEFEMIALGLETSFEDSYYQDSRYNFLSRAGLYEKFLKKYPKSLLVAAARLAIAEIYQEIELPIINELRTGMDLCIRRAHDRQKIDLCQALFDVNKLAPMYDLVYRDLAAEILTELIEKNGYDKHYVMVRREIGGFRFIDEDVGGYALFILGSISKPEFRNKHYADVLESYKVRSAIKEFIEEFLKTH